MAGTVQHEKKDDSVKLGRCEILQPLRNKNNKKLMENQEKKIGGAWGVAWQKGSGLCPAEGVAVHGSSTVLTETGSLGKAFPFNIYIVQTLSFHYNISL